MPRFVGVRLEKIQPQIGEVIHVEVTFETAPSVTWDAVVVPQSDARLAELGQAVEFLKDQYRHCKPILVLSSQNLLAEAAQLPVALPDGSADPGLVGLLDLDSKDGIPDTTTDALLLRFVGALARSPSKVERETDPPQL